jgi:TATA-box binding protein (TBP) (component of TFIID and TFIIIB)
MLRDYKNNQSIQDVINNFKIELLPGEVTISTITISCKTKINFLYDNIRLYSKFNTKMKSTTQFYNAIAIDVKIPSKTDPITVRLCSNGSLHMTGCKDVMSAVETINIIFNEFSKIKAIKDYEIGKMVEKPFVKDLNSLSFDKILDLRICMINSGFSMNFKINKPALYKLFKKINVECYLSETHAAVNIKYKHPEKIVTIFVFESGSIILTGGTTCEQIEKAYKFIKKYLLYYKDKICLKDKNTNTDINIFMNK